MRLIDTHCHPQMGDYDGDRREILQRSFAADTGIIAVGTTVPDSLAGIRLAEEYPDQPIWAAVGIHPTDEDISEVRVDELDYLLDNPKVVAIGECGLDYFHLKDIGDQQLQQDIFEQQILLAQQSNKPLIIHCRDRVGVYDAYDDVLTLLRKHQVSHFVMHCYSGTWEYAEKFLELGGLLSFTGIATFPKSETMQEVIRQVPAERYMLETDAPFLAPVPQRGKRNEPSYVQHIAAKVAEIRGQTVDEVAVQTTRTAEHFFRLPAAFNPDIDE
jgi:TatD DNase family protein